MAVQFRDRGAVRKPEGCANRSLVLARSISRVRETRMRIARCSVRRVVSDANRLQTTYGSRVSRQPIVMVMLLSLLGTAATAQAQNAITPGALNLKSTFDNIGVRAPFSG